MTTIPTIYFNNASYAWDKLGSDIDGEAVDDQSGYSVSLSSDGTTVAIGAPNNDSNGLSNRGHVRVYRYDNSVWSQVGSDIDGEALGDNSGYSVSLSSDGTTVAIGSISNDGNGLSSTGHVRVYRYDNSALTARTSINLNWYSIASSSDGTKLAAVVSGGQIYTSTDSGGTWFPRESSRSWVSIASSSDGTKLAAVVSGGQIYTSTDSGVIWTAREGSRSWRSITSSSDGTKLAAVVSGSQIYTSTDSGMTWFARGGSPSLSWFSIASSSDGTKLAAVVFGGQIYTSTDSGMTWFAQTIINRSWRSITSSSDGTKLAAVVNGGQIYTSTDSGGTWFPRESSRNWYSIASSSDGTKLSAVVYGGQIYTSTDSGVIWTARESSRYWYSIASSSDGTKLAAVVYGRQIYTNIRSWSQVGSDIDGEAAYDYSGYSVSLSSDGTTVAIGAPNNDSNGLSNRGHVRVYRYDNSVWSQVGSDIDGEALGDYSGRSVSLSSDGTTVAVGAPYNDGNSNDNRGHVRVYRYDNNSGWSQLGSNIYGEAADDKSGMSVSLSSDGTTVAIGAPYNDGNGLTDRGHVRVYRYDNNSGWSQLGSNIYGEAADDKSGMSVSLTSDGTTVAIGAPYNDGNGLTDRGHVRVYRYDNSVWSQVGSDIDGEAAYDYSGYSVSLSSDGTTVAIGALHNDGNGLSSTGHVRVYKINTSITKTTPSLTNFSNITKTYGDSMFDITDPSSNSLGNFTYRTIDTGVASISGKTVIIVGAGTATITATQAETANFSEVSKNFTLTVIKATPSLTNFSNITKTYGDASFNITDPSSNSITDPSSNSLGNFTYRTIDTGVARISGNTVIIVGAGTATITATQAETDNFSEVSKNFTLTVIKATPSLTNFSNITKTYGDASFNITDPSSNSLGNFTYRTIDTDVAIISGKNVTIVGAGTATITATQAETANFSEVSMDVPLVVIPATPNLSNFPDIYKRVNDIPFEITDPISNSLGNFTYAITDARVASISGKNVTINNSGNSEITATQAQTDNYTSGSITSNLFISNICFPVGTLITTDQEIIAIEKINPSIHTIRNKKIVGVTQTIGCYDFLICFKKNALGTNVPSEKTYMSPLHKVFCHKKMRTAIECIEFSEHIYKTRYNGDILYNVLMEEHDKMLVNNLICETLHPDNLVAKLYNIMKEYTLEEQERIVKACNRNTLKKYLFNKKQIKRLRKFS